MGISKSDEPGHTIDLSGLKEKNAFYHDIYVDMDAVRCLLEDGVLKNF